jgi:hypothetical protein
MDCITAKNRRKPKMKRNERIARYGVKKYVETCLNRKVRKSDYTKYGKEKAPSPKLKEVLAKIRETPLIQRPFRPIPTHITRTYTESGRGERLYQLIVTGAYRNEKTGEVEEQTHYSHTSTEKDFKGRYEDAVTRPGAEPESNWILITDPEDPDYIEIKMEWRVFGGKKGFAPSYREYLEKKRR